MSAQDLSAKTILVTGANCGIGKAATLELARRGATTIMACRNVTKAREAQTEIRGVSDNDAVRLIELDLSDLRSVERCAREVAATSGGLDVLIDNAGATFPSRVLTAQGFEQTFAVNYLGHYVLTRLLLPLLLQRPSSRVISVSSDGHKFVKGIRWDDLTFERGYSVTAAYANAKLAEVLFTRELARRYGKAGLFAAAVHPGFVGSEFYSLGPFGWALGPIARVFGRSPERGAETVVYVASSSDALRANGGYWADCKQGRPSIAASDDAAARRLWELSERLVGDAGTVLADASSVTV